MRGHCSNRQSPPSSGPNSLTASSISVASTARRSGVLRRAAPRVRHATPPRSTPQPHRGVPTVNQMADSLKATGRLSDLLLPLSHLGATLQSVSNPPSAPVSPGAFAYDVGTHVRVVEAARTCADAVGGEHVSGRRVVYSACTEEPAAAALMSRASPQAPASPQSTPRSPSPSLAPTSFAAASSRLRAEAEHALHALADQGAFLQGFFGVL